MQENTLLEFSLDIYTNAIMNQVSKSWNFISFSRCWDWCYDDSYMPQSNMLAAVESLNPLCTRMYVVTKQSAQI